MGRVLIADTPRKRAFGLLTLPPLAENEVLWLEPCNGIHTLGMKYAIDVISLDRSGVILALNEKVRPFRFVFFRRHVRTTLEARSGFIARHRLHIGQKIALITEEKTQSLSTD